jgi:hypothetical protein
MNISNKLIALTLNHQLWQPTIAPGSFAHIRASAKISSGNFIHVPVIVGTNVSDYQLICSPTNLRKYHIVAE